MCVNILNVLVEILKLVLEVLKINKLEKQVISDWKKLGMISKIAEKNAMTLERARKILISNNIFPNTLSKEIAKMQLEGWSPSLIQKKLNISNKTFNTHVGY